MINIVASEANELIEILEKLVRVSRELLDSAKRKQAVLATDKLDDLQEVLQKEESLTAELEKVEQQRLSFQRKNSTWPATLSEQLTILPEQCREQATKLAQEFAGTTEALYIQNTINSEIIQHLLNFTGYNLEQLYKMNTGPAYGSRGDFSSPVAGRAVVDRKI